MENQAQFTRKKADERKPNMASRLDDRTVGCLEERGNTTAAYMILGSLAYIL